MTVVAEHWAVLVDDAPEWNELVHTIEVEAADKLARLFKSEPGSAAQTRLVGELDALVKVVGIPAVVRRAVDRERSKQQR